MKKGNIMKRLFALLIVFSLLLSVFTACTSMVPPVETGDAETTDVVTDHVDTHPHESTAPETEKLETAPLETEPADTDSIETEPVETIPDETNPVETTPIETQPIETAPAETEPAETEPPHVHAWGNWTTSKEATCTETGMSERVCACGETETQDIEALGHTEAVDAAVAPTCTETGLTEGKHCSVCNEVLTGQETVEALGHSFGEWYETKAPTETEQGEKRRDCVNCEHYETTKIAVLGHDHSRWEVITLEAVAPTCTATGLTEGKKCSGCDAILVVQEVIPATGHTEIIDEAVAPTCTETGLTEGKHCSVCNEVLTAQETIPATGHSFGEWYATKVPTEMENGEQRRDCTNCNHYETTPIAALSHNHDRWETIILEAVAPTCTTTGLTEGKKCSGCGEILVAQEVIPANGHSMGGWVQTKAPTCTISGTEKCECANCDHDETRSVAAAGHNHTAVVTAPTCTAKGYTTHTCHCGDSYMDSYVNALGHSFGEWYETKAPTESAQGEKRRDCANCDHYETTPIAALTHSHDRWETITLESIAATCTSTGLTEGKKCSGCGEILVAQEVTPALGHSFGEWYETKAPTCTVSGTEKRDCGNCVYTEIRAVTASGHSYESVVTAPTCTKQGFTTYTCHCGDTYVDDYVGATGHTMGAWLETKSPTCTVSGTEKRVCVNCTYEETRSVAAAGHGYEAVVTAPTCTKKGYTTHTCHCGDSYVDSYVNARGHSFGEWYETKAPTESAQGEKRRDCANCDHYETTPVAALAHDHNRWNALVLPAVVPTCDSTGLTEGKKCSSCGELLIAQEIIPATGHAMSNWKQTKVPTCTAAGTEKRECFKCDHEETRSVAATGHGYNAVVTKPTCTEKGYTTHTCYCGDTYVDSYVNALGHAFGDWTVTVQPTCTTSGSERRECANCDHFETREVAALGHRYMSAFTPPTATEDGYTTFTCSSCGHSYAEVVTPVSFTITKSNRSKIGYTGVTGEELVIPAVFKDGQTWYRVTSIGSYTFSSCSGLTSIVIPDSVTSIDYHAFAWCSGLTSVTIPDSVTSIGSYAFAYCDGLTSVTIPTGVASIGSYAFYVCSGLTSVTIPDSVTSIGEDAFAGCSGLTSIVIPDSVTSIGNGAFYGCTGLTSVTVPDSVTSIGRSAFSACTGLTSITIGNSVTSIGYCAFAWCSGLTSVTIPDSVTSIGEYAFAHCDGLTSVTIPDSVTSIGEGAFYNCARLTDIYFTGTQSQWNAITKGTNWDYDTPVYAVHFNYDPNHSHTEIIVAAVSPTCTTTGLTEGKKCSGCGEILVAQEIIPATGHSYEATVTQPTCTDRGYTTHTCHCGDTYVDSYVNALGHSFGVWNVTEAPTCTEKGSEHRDCVNCDYSETREVAATGHEYDSVVTAPTCTDRGYTTHTCHCGDSYVDSYVNALGHSFGDWYETKAPTESAQGEKHRDCENCDHFETTPIAALTHSHDRWEAIVLLAVVPTCNSTGLTEGKKCSGCGEILVDQEVIPATGHNMGNWVEIKAPTCTEKGTEKRECSKCYHLETREIEALDHSYDSVITAPTCTEKGYTTHTCHCGDSYVDSYVNAFGHSFGEWYETKAPTCTVVGSEKRECSKCDHFEAREVAAPGHKYESVAMAPTCTEQGYTTHTCHCGDSYVDSYVNALGHAFGKWYETKAPTEASQGEKRRDCANCDHCETTPVAALAHSHDRWDVIVLPSVAPTCTATGLTEGKKCSGCGEILVAQEIVPATDHYMGNWVEIKAPTCTEKGSSRRECSNCDYTETCEVAALGHAYESVVTVPTCTEQGYTTHTCHCGNSYVDSHVNALGHSFGDWYETKTPTESAQGEKRRDCANCDHYETTPVAALAHSHDRWETITLEAVAPTCTATGLTEGKKCSGCGEILVAQEAIPATGHAYEAIVTPPTVTEDGCTEYICGLCEDTYRDMITPVNFEITSLTRNKIGYTGEEREKLVIPAVFQDEGIWYRVTSISNYAFYNCSNLDSITIPDSVTSIGEAAFNKCSSVTSITISDSVTSIGWAAFGGCSSLTSITIPNNVKRIEDSAFYNCSSLTSITIPDNVKSIGGSTFYNCSSLTSITIPDSVTSIGWQAFSGCSSLTSITIPDNVTSIGSAAFYNCSSLTSITIPDNVTSIGSAAFYNCSSLTSITIPDNVTSIADEAFESCSSLTYITIPDNVKSIGDGAFADCSSLTSIVIGNSVTSIGEVAFARCSSLNSVTIPDSVTSIGVGVFSNCSSLTSITIPNGVAIIVRYAFDGCSSLTSVTIGNGVTRIVGEAFYNCSSLTDIYFTGTESEWNAIEKQYNWDYSTPDYIVHFNYDPNHSHTEIIVAAVTPTCTTTGLTEGKKCSSCGEILVAQEVIPATGHTMGNWIEAKSPTCTAEGTEQRGCLKCDYFETREVKATGHNYDSAVTAPTATEDGYTLHTCSICSNTYRDSIITPEAFMVTDENIQKFHNGDYVSIPAVFQDENGIWYRVTEIDPWLYLDGEYISYMMEIPSSVSVIPDFYVAARMDLGDFVVLVPKDHPNYSNDNRSVLFNKNQTELIYYPGFAGNYTIPDGVSVIGTYAFTDCKTLTSITIPNSVIKIGRRAFQNCTALTTIYFVGTQTEWNAIDKEVGWNSGCSTTAVVCSDGVVCISHTEAIDAAVAPTCTNTGLTAGKHCSVCGEILVEQIVVDALGHTEVIDVGVAPTCTRSGLTEGKHCSVCGDVIVAQNIVNALGHQKQVITSTETTVTLYSTTNSSLYPFSVSGNQITSTNKTNSSSSTYTITAKEAFTLELQYKVSSETNYDKLIIKHNSATKVTVSGTSTSTFTSLSINMSAGDTVTITYSKDASQYSGSDCAWVKIITPSTQTVQTEKIEYVTITESNRDVYASCIEAVLCDVCGEVAIEKIAHIEVIDAAILPTCETAGLTEGKHCSVCNEVLVAQNVVDAIGHKYTSVVTDPTCTEEGYTTHTCDNCGNSYTDTLIDAFGHKWSEWITIKESTLTEEGLMERSCSCGDKETQTIEKIPPELTYTLNDDGQSYSVTGMGTWMDPVLVIPPEHKGLPVTSIAENAFHGCEALTGIVIPDSITYIGPRAFKDCDNITSVSVPDDVTIDYLAFGWCDNLNSVLIGKNVIFNSSHAFDYCTKLTSVVIGDGATSIGEYAFNECTSLTSVTIPSSVTAFKTSSFSRCSALTNLTFEGTIAQWNAITKGTSWNYNTSEYTIYCADGEISKNGTVTCYHTFTSVSAISAPTATENGSKTYTCPSCGYTHTEEIIPTEFTVTSGNREKVGYTGATGQNLVIPAVFEDDGTWYRVKIIDNGAFYNCSTIESVTIPDSVTSVNRMAFAYCSNLTSITIGNAVTTLGDYAIESCPKLNSVIIGASVATIGEGMFSYCDNITSITVNDSNLTYLSIDGNLYSKDKKTFIKYATGKTNESLVLPNSVITIGDDAFWNCSTLKSITIPNSVTSFGDNAFRGCSSLVGITIPNGVTNIGDYAFCGCSSLTSVVIPNGVTYIGDCAFEYCTSLKGSIIIPDSVTYLGYSAFSECAKITSAVVGNSVPELSSYVFGDCSSLKSITIGTGVKTIDPYAFSGCSGLNAVCISDIAAWCDISLYDSIGGVSTPLIIAKNLYLNGTLVTNLVIPEGVTKIGSKAFMGCTSLTNITIPNSVKTIGNDAFRGCTSLKNVVIPNSVEYISWRAFQNCTSLESVTLGNSLNYIYGNAFQGCSALKNIVIPASVETIGPNAFSNCTSLTSVTFETTNRWLISSSSSTSSGGTILSSTNFSDPTKAAEYLTSTYVGKYWLAYTR